MLNNLQGMYGWMYGLFIVEKGEAAVHNTYKNAFSQKFKAHIYYTRKCTLDYYYRVYHSLATRYGKVLFNSLST